MPNEEQLVPFLTALVYMSRPGIEPITSRSPGRTFYLLSYRGRWSHNVSYSIDIFCRSLVTRISHKVWIYQPRFYWVCSWAAVIQTTRKWAATWQNQQSDCAPTENSDQPGHQADLSLRWAHTHFVCFVMSRLKYNMYNDEIRGDFPGWPRGLHVLSICIHRIRTWFKGSQ